MEEYVQMENIGLKEFHIIVQIKSPQALANKYQVRKSIMEEL